MELLGNIIRNYLKDLGIEKPIKGYEALQLWSSVVGEKISEVTDPVRISNGKLFIKVKSDSWRNELIYHKQKIIRDINQRLETRTVTDIVFI